MSKNINPNTKKAIIGIVINAVIAILSALLGDLANVTTLVSNI